MPKILSIGTALPTNAYTQDQLIEEMKIIWKAKGFNFARVEQIHKNVSVHKRHLALPVERYHSLVNFKDKNDAWIETAVPLSQKAIQNALNNASELKISDISLIMTSTVTGIAVPSLDARLVNLFPFSDTIKRVPLMGLGCLAGAAGINRVADYLVGHPKEAAILVCTELCSLTFQFDDFSAANFVATGLFGDGSACVVMVGDEHPLSLKALFNWKSGSSFFFRDTSRVMGWDIVNTGLKIVLGKEVPAIAKEKVPQVLDLFLKNSSLSRSDINFQVAHPGGPKVLIALQEGLGLKQEDFKHSWDGLERFGNMSSASVLFIFNEYFKNLPPRNSLGLISAMGPGFCAEFGLIESLGP